MACEQNDAIKTFPPGDEKPELQSQNKDKREGNILRSNSKTREATESIKDPTGDLSKNVSQLVTTAMETSMEKLVDPELETGIEDYSTEDLVQHIQAETEKIPFLEASINVLAAFLIQISIKQKEVMALVKLLKR